MTTPTNRHRPGRLAVALIALLALMGCGKTLGSKEDFVKKMAKSGMTSKQAGCVYDKLEGDQDTLDKLDKMKEGDDPPAKATAAITSCLGLGDLTTDTTSTDDTSADATDDTSEDSTDDTSEDSTDDTSMDSTDDTSEDSTDDTSESAAGDDTELLSSLDTLSGELDSAATPCDLSKVFDGITTLPNPTTLEGGQATVDLMATLLTQISSTAPDGFETEAKAIADAATALGEIQADNVDDMGTAAGATFTDEVQKAMDTFKTEADKTC